MSRTRNSGNCGCSSRNWSVWSSLTGAWNRAYLDRMIELEFSRSARNQQPLSLVMLDIDHFKKINDCHGHQAGDIVLQELVRTV